MTVSDIPDTRCRALHTFRDIAPYENNRAMLIDLFALAGAEKLFFPRVESSVVAFSGFSKLAQELHAERHSLGDFFYRARHERSAAGHGRGSRAVGRFHRAVAARRREKRANAGLAALAALAVRALSGYREEHGAPLLLYGGGDRFRLRP